MKKKLLFLSLIILLTIAVGCSGITTAENTNIDTTGTTNTQITSITNSEVSSTTSSDTTALERYQTINLFSMNDFHGGTYSNINNLEYIGAYLKYQKANYTNTIILADGDIFQGAALSNYYYGAPIVDVFNNIGFDGFVLGNHEFDWGIDKILKYRDGQADNDEMDFPILAANIVYKDTLQPLEHTIPYIIKEVSGVRVGIIGLIGNIINSISASRVENITFLNPADTVYKYAAELRTTKDCDIVVVYIHSGSDFDYEIKDFTGDHYVDAVFNGHTHWKEASTMSRSDGQPLVYAQSHNDNGSLFSKITLQYDTLNKEVVSVAASTFSYDQISFLEDKSIRSILEEYQNDSVYVNFVGQVLANVSATYYRDDLATWGASVVRDYAGVDVGAVNSGGFRKSMPQGVLTMGDMIEIYPFDNYIKTSKLTGSQLLNFYEDDPYDVVFDDSLTYDGTNLYIKGVLVEPDVLYTVGAVDYIFDKTDFAFLDGQDITQTILLMRDLLVEDLLATEGSFNPYNGTSYQELAYIYNPFFYNDQDRSLII